jgi:1-acyl-sn-glycerol-3-phosphate acyltransferase
MADWKLEPARDFGLNSAQRFQSLRRESGLITTGSHIAWALLVRTYMKIWHRLEIAGREHLPLQPPFALLANHCSHLDALTLAAPLPIGIRDQVFSLAAGDVFFEKALTAAFATTMINALPLWRRRTSAHALEELRHRLVEEPCAFILFPEGSRSRDGKMARFKPGLGKILAGTTVPVVPCYLDGCYEALPSNGVLPRPKKIRMLVGPALSFADVPDERSGWDEIARRSQEAVARLGGAAHAVSGESAPD